MAALGAAYALVCVEQVYRNTAPHGRWAVKFLCIAGAATFAYDLALQSDALLSGHVDPGWWAARGAAHALVAPLVAVTAARMPGWRLDVQVSRHVVFHTATLAGATACLFAAAVLGHGLRLIGGPWGGITQAILVFAAATAIATLLASGGARARLRVTLAKHFFTFRYDYRSEWLRLTELLSQPGPEDAGAGDVAHRALAGLASLVESPSGALWIGTDDGRYVCTARLAIPERPVLGRDDPVVRLVESRDWTVDVQEWREHPERHAAGPMPGWLGDDPDAWLVVPLTANARTVGFVQLQRPRAPFVVDWEVRDVLKTAGRQAASYLALGQAVEKLVQAQQFDSFNRMSAFVVHDLKNLVSQLTLLLRNVPRHRDNPEFQSDMIGTVENVVDRMQALLLQLRVGARPIEPPSPVPLGAAVRSAVSTRRALVPTPSVVLDAELERMPVVAHRDRLERVIGHLLQNAADAAGAGGSVRVSARRDGPTAIVEISDNGPGMSRTFIETRLFKPFASTKEHGMGIGAFESREYLREIGGTLGVRSAEGSGTTFEIRLPLHVASVPAAESVR